MVKKFKTWTFLKVGLNPASDESENWAGRSVAGEGLR